MPMTEHTASCELTKTPHHDDVIKWKHFPRSWPFVRGIHRAPVNSPHKGQWRGALMFSLICTWINAWVNNREAGDLRCHHAHNDVIVMYLTLMGDLWGIKLSPNSDNKVNFHFGRVNCDINWCIIKSMAAGDKAMQITWEVFHYAWRALQMSFRGILFSRIELAPQCYGTFCARKYMTASHRWCESVI